MSELYPNRIALIPINNYSGCMNMHKRRIFPHSSFSFPFFNLELFRQHALRYNTQSAFRSC